LFFIDRTSYLEMRNADGFFAEGHARLTMPLLNIAMALIAALAVIGGDFSRRGYSRRITIATAGAIVLVVVQLSVQSASADDRALNVLQYLVPLGVIAGVAYLSFARGGHTKVLNQRRFLLRERIDASSAQAPAGSPAE
ncbi:MAG: hypothetical protein AAFY85_04185, partial [Pseudomonadota bacterium]